MNETNTIRWWYYAFNLLRNSTKTFSNINHFHAQSIPETSLANSPSMNPNHTNVTHTLEEACLQKCGQSGLFAFVVCRQDECQQDRVINQTNGEKSLFFLSFSFFSSYFLKNELQNSWCRWNSIDVPWWIL